MNLSRITVICLLLTIAAACQGMASFVARDGMWLHNDKPFYSSTAHAIYHKFREDRAGAIEDLKNLKKAGFTVVESYWQWSKDLDPATMEYNFQVFDDFTMESKKAGLYNFCMFQEYVPIWLADKYGWGHTDEEGKRDVRCDDFYVGYQTYEQEWRRYYTALIEHLKQKPEIAENILYWNMGGEYKPFKPHRQEKPVDFGYDDTSVALFRQWMQEKGWTPEMVAQRWGAPVDAYRVWADVWPAVNMKEADYKGTPLANIHAARWDWYDFRQEVSTQHLRDVFDLVRNLGDNRPWIHEYNIITPGGVLPFLRWSRLGARTDGDGVYLSSGTFDREFDFNSLLYNLAICRGASIAPWQSNEQKGNTPPEWMQKHAWLLVGMGGTGMHFWDWCGKGWGVVNPDGSPSEGYPSAVRINEAMKFANDLINASKPMPNRIGVLALAEETFYLPRGHDREISAVLNTILQHGWGNEVAVITDDEVLLNHISDYKLIIVPGQVHMRQEVRERLADYVRRGGTLWLTPGSASRDEADRELAAPGAPLDKVAGAKITGEREPVMGPIRVGNQDSEDSAYGMLDKVVDVASAEPVAYLNGEPAIWMNHYGRGRCIFQPTHSAYLPGNDTPLSNDKEALGYYFSSNSGQPPVELLYQALEEPYARAYSGSNVNTNVFAGVRRVESGYLVILVEADNRTHDVRVKLNKKRLGLEGDWVAYSPFSLETAGIDKSDWAFKTKMTPSQVKVFHLVPKAESAKWIAEFKARNWTSLEAALPPIPEKKLVPPSEIGKVEIADLKAIKPIPHGDDWLLLDFSKHANRSLVDEGKMENAKSFLGGVGVGDNDLSELPSGMQEFLGIPFKILDPAVNTNSCLITKTVGRPWLGPLKFTGIPVREKVSKIHWLYGSGWAPFDLPVGYITYNYSDGSKEHENLVMGKNIMNWWGKADLSKNPKLRLAWSGMTPAAQRNFTSVGLYEYAWDNPHPAKTVESVDITSYGGDACIIVVAATAEK